MTRKPKRALQSFIKMGLGLAMLFYAVPELPAFSWSPAGLFVISWLLFAVLIIGSNLYYLVGVDKERKLRDRRQLEWEQEVNRVAAKLQYERRRRRMLSRE